MWSVRIDDKFDVGDKSDKVNHPFVLDTSSVTKNLRIVYTSLTAKEKDYIVKI